MNSHKSLLLLSIVTLAVCSACGGGGGMVTKNTQTFTIGGTLTGLAANATVVLQDNGGDNLSVSANGSFVFATKLALGATYNVTVFTQPSGQTCSVSGGTGTVGNANVVGIAVTCSSTTQTFTIGGTLSGLASGATVVLQDNGGDNLSLTANGAFTFATAVAAGGAYNVTVLTQPTGQSCNVTNASGTANANVTNVSVACVSSVGSFTIGGTLSGLASGATVILQDNGGDNLPLTANGSFTFATAIPAGGAYAVTVLTQPAGQTCTVSNGSGTANANVTNVGVTCAAVTYSIGGTLSGLASGASVVLQDNGGDNLSLTANGSFTFATKLTAGSAYAVTVLTQPTGQSCSVSNGSGVVSNANITNVGVTCSSNATLTVSATVTGLTGTLVLQDDQSQQLTFTSNTTQTFSNKYVSGATYSVTILTQPTGQSCTLSSNSAGTITANVTVTATCTTLYTISAAVSGLTSGTLILADDKTDQLTFTTDGTQMFASSYLSGSTYSVTISQQPTGLTCTLGSNATGTITANVTVNVTCAAAALTLSVKTTGLSTGTLIVQDDQSQTLSFTTNTTQAFSNTYASGASYSVTVTQQPSGETCSLSSNSTGTITANTTVSASCTSSSSTGQWTWIDGADVVAVGGLYPPSSPVYPGTRYGASSWIDASGHFWLFGGIGYDINGPSVTDTTKTAAESVLSDLWEYDGTNWNFKEGQAQNGQCFTFPTLGTAGSPSSRTEAANWIDSSGNLWIFGGYEAYNQPDCLVGDAFNDLWEYTPSTNTWVWQGGSSTNGQAGIYPSSVGGTGTPGARYLSAGAQDASGNFWMFGGYGYDSAKTLGFLNDIWEYVAATNQWIWQGGSKTANHNGVYSGSGVAPGTRYGANSWIDSSGNFWLFGGDSYDSSGGIGDMNDLWELSLSTLKWTFVGGAKIANTTFGTYGTSNDWPGQRVWGTTWLTPSGDVWLFGGVYSLRDDFYNDLWKYSGGQWTFEGPPGFLDSNNNPVFNQTGQYGTIKIGSSANAPGSRQEGVAWTDSGGNLWMFGGYGLGLDKVSEGDTNVHHQYDSLQDLWEFVP